MAAALRPNTRLVIVSHASSVLGTTQPIGEIADACAARGVPLLVDAAQSAGHVPITLSGLGGDRGRLHRPQGPPGPERYRRPGAVGRGSRSRRLGSAERGSIRTASGTRPAYPHRLEAGTLNLLGIIGLSLGLDHLEVQGMERTHRREMALIQRLRDGLIGLPRLTIHSPPLGDDDIPVLTCSIEGIAADDVGAILDADYGIAVRTGLHCAPLVHHDLGTEAEGGVRFSLGIATTELEIDAAIDAMGAIAGAA